MMDRMNYYNSLQTKMTRKLNVLKNLTNYELYPEDFQDCKSNFLCYTITKISSSVVFEQKMVTDLDRLILLIDLVTLEAIDLGKREDSLEMVLQVNRVKIRSISFCLITK